MAPQPHKVELDLDRKEELIIAKQLRACRVNILPRVNLDSCYQVNASSLTPSPKVPASPVHFSSRNSISPKPPSTLTTRDSPNEIAMRYWNQCQTGESDKKISFKDEYAAKEGCNRKVVDQKIINPQKLPKIPAVPDIRDRMGEEVMQRRGESATAIHVPSFSVRGQNSNERADAKTSTQAKLENPSKPPKLPFLQDIELLKRKEQPITAPVEQIPVLPPKTKVNAHIGHIENRPKIGDLPFLNDIKGLRSSPNIENVTENYEKGTENISMRSLSIQDSDQEQEVVKQNVLQTAGKLRNVKSPSPKVVSFSDDELQSKDQRKQESSCHASEDAKEKKPSKPPKSKKSSKFNIKIDEKTNMSKLSDQIIPQLNTMQKNYLGLLFFNELSQNIVEDIVAQQLTMLAGSRLAALLGGLDQQVCNSAVPQLMNSTSEEIRTAIVCDAFSDLDTEDKAGVLFTTSNDVMEVCETIAGFGGRAFKKALVQNIISKEDPYFLDEILHIENKNRQVEAHVVNQRKNEDKRMSSADDENFNSAEEDFVDEEVYDYEYFEFENK